jgi:hypothetical protein
MDVSIYSAVQLQSFGRKPSVHDPYAPRLPIARLNLLEKSWPRCTVRAALPAIASYVSGKPSGVRLGDDILVNVRSTAEGESTRMG